MTDRIDFGGEPWHAIPREVLRDARLSPRAKGGLVTLLSHDEGWVRSAIGTLMRENRCGREIAQSIMRDLASLGYAVLHQSHDSQGRFTTAYTVYAFPQVQAPEAINPPSTVQPSTVQPSTVKPSTEVEALDVDPKDEYPKALLTSGVSELSDLLADLIEANGAKRPTVGKAWLRSADLLLRKDQRPREEVEIVMRWCQADPFWRSVVLSMPKFRDKYDALKLRMNGTKPKRSRAAEIMDQALALSKAGL
jgi:hypothetical protein